MWPNSSRYARYVARKGESLRLAAQASELALVEQPVLVHYVSSRTWLAACKPSKPEMTTAPVKLL
jgi:hypothetical protein